MPYLSSLFDRQSSTVGVQLEMLDSLLDDAVDLSETDIDGSTRLHRAVGAALGKWVGGEPLIEDMDTRATSESKLLSTLGSSLLRHQRHSASALEAAQQMYNKDGLLPLHVAVMNGSVAICGMLLQAGAAVNAYTLRRAWTFHSYDGTTLHCGYWVERDEGGHIKRLQPTDRTALHLAIDLLTNERRADKEDGVDADGASLVTLLCEAGADLDALDMQKRTPLHVAVSAGLHDVVRLLSPSAEQSSAVLHTATIRRDVRMIHLLVRHGARIDDHGRHGQGNGWTPLCLAARLGAAEVIRALLWARASMHATSANGKTALEIAAINAYKQGGQAVLEALHVEMVASVLEIAFGRHLLPATPPLQPTSSASLPPEALLLPPAAADSQRPSASEGVSLLHHPPTTSNARGVCCAVLALSPSLLLAKQQCAVLTPVPHNACAVGSIHTRIHTPAREA